MCSSQRRHPYRNFLSTSLPLCPTIHNASIGSRDAPCSLASSSNELSPWLTQDGEAIHDKIENSLITQDSSHPSSSLMLREDNLLIQLDHVSSPINLSLDVPLEEPPHLRNMIIVETCDRDGCHQERSFEISRNNHPKAMHDFIQVSKCDSTILKCSRMCQGVEALQHLSMVMSRFCDFGKPPNQIRSGFLNTVYLYTRFHSMQIHV